MPVAISLLRGVNVGGHHTIQMDALRELYESLGLRDPRTYINSGNVVFRTEARDLARLAKRIENAIERRFGFHCDVIVRTCAEMREAVASNPFAARRDIEPGKLAVIFLARDPGREARENVLRIETEPEELRIVGREVYIYYPNGMGRPRVPMALVEKTVQTSGTGRNWNTVRKLLEMAEELGASR